MKINLSVLTKSSSFLLLLVITLIGTFFRLENLSLFNVYPDSYQSLIVALNITNYHDILGYLGSNGMVYPDFFSWTHPGYPLLIDAVSVITHNMTQSARSITFLAGVLTIPLSYVFIKRVFSSNRYGLAGAFLTAFSFNHTVWSGFIMTETTGVFFMMLFFINIFTTVKAEDSWFNWRDCISGILFFFAVITRYEYIILLVPVFFLISFTEKHIIKRLITFFSIFLIIVSLIIIILYPLPSTFTVIFSQLQNELTKGWIIVLLSLLFIYKKYFLSKTMIDVMSKYLHFFIIFLIGVSLVILKTFFMHEILLTFFSFIGFCLLLTKRTTRIYGYFAFIGSTCLLLFYYSVNPDMERYITHIIPFLLIPASYGLIETVKLVNKKKILLRLVFLLLLLCLINLQTFLTISGLKYAQDSSWYRTSYEDKAAALVKKHIPNNTYLLITSYPEPYYYSLHLSIQSIADVYPYIFMNDVKGDQPILVIEDMGMHDDFPHFTNFLNKNMSQYKFASFWVHEKFHYIDTVQQEKYPIIIYKTTLQTLNKKIVTSH